MDDFCEKSMCATGDFELQRETREEFSDDTDDTIENEDRSSDFCKAVRYIEYRENLECSDTYERVDKSDAEDIEPTSQEYEFPVFTKTEEESECQKKYRKGTRIDTIDYRRDDDDREESFIRIIAQKV